MNNNLRSTFVLTPLLLVIWLANCALDAHAEWEHIPGTEVFGRVRLLESDGLRLYAIGDTGFYYSFDDGYTWRRRAIGRGIEDFYITAIGSGDGVVYVGTVNHGMFRSDSGGNTWKQINEGLHIFNDPIRGPRRGIVQQLLVTSSGMVINVGYHWGTHISNNRGDTWHSVLDEWIYPGNPDWHFGDSIFSMTEFDGYLWAVYSGHHLCLSDDQGETWERLHNNMKDFTSVRDWAILDSRLYVAGGYSLGRWNEDTLAWDALDRGLPSDTDINSLAVNRNRIFAVAPVFGSGVWLFDEMSDTWMPVGMQGVPVFIETILSHKSDLYAASNRGIYRTSVPVIHSYNKAAVTWGALKTK